MSSVAFLYKTALCLLLRLESDRSGSQCGGRPDKHPRCKRPSLFSRFLTSGVWCQNQYLPNYTLKITSHKPFRALQETAPPPKKNLQYQLDKKKVSSHLPCSSTQTNSKHLHISQSTHPPPPFLYPAVLINPNLPFLGPNRVMAEPPPFVATGEE